jgi:hypothetical protein
MKSIFIFSFFILLVFESCKKDSNEPTPQPKSPLDSGMIAFYPFNGNANDESGNNYHLIVKSAMLTSDRFGKSSKAYSFNGTDAIMTIPKFNNADAVDHFTISIWAKPKIESGQAFLLSLSSQSTYAHSIQLIKNSSSYQSWIEIVRCQPGTSVCGSQYFNQFINDPTDKWTHFVVGQNNSSPFLYINGQEVALSGFYYSPISFANGGIIGSAISGTSGFYKGDLDDIRIYNRTLSQEEIQQLFNEKP